MFRKGICWLLGNDSESGTCTGVMVKVNCTASSMSYISQCWTQGDCLKWSGARSESNC